jgi:CheY-like chemotaxis protein
MAMAYRLMVIPGSSEALSALPGQLGDVDVKLLESVNDALWEVRSDPPEAIIADVDLPDMNGLEMAEILSSFDVPTRVLLYSRSQNAGAQKQAEEFGVYNFLQEPISSEELHAALHEALAATPPEPVAPPPAPEPEPEPEPAPTPPPAPQREQPARVRLPAAAARAARSGGSGSSPRPAPAPRPAPPPPEEDPATSATPTPRQGGRRKDTLVLTADNLAPIQSIMSRLAQDLGTQCIMLTDRAGMVLVEVGTTHDLPTMILLPLLSTSFSTTGEVARQLHEEDATTLYIHEGVNYDLYCFDIVQRFLLVLVFNKKVATSKIGTVWISTKRAIRELHDALS